MKIGDSARDQRQQRHAPDRGPPPPWRSLGPPEGDFARDGRYVRKKVSEGGLVSRSWWYIPESGIYHHSKLTRQGPTGPQSADEKRRPHWPAWLAQACELRKWRGR